MSNEEYCYSGVAFIRKAWKLIEKETYFDTAENLCV